jgi:hypothetical protein
VDASLEHPVAVHCIGGFVLATLYGLPRPTADIDYIAIDSAAGQTRLMEIAGLGSKLSRKHKLYFQQVGIAEVPENYEDRLVKLDLGLERLKILVLEEYDLVLSKLGRCSPKDAFDVKFISSKINQNFEELCRRWEIEMKPWVANADRQKTTLQLWREYFPVGK